MRRLLCCAGSRLGFMQGMRLQQGGSAIMMAHTVGTLNARSRALFHRSYWPPSALPTCESSCPLRSRQCCCSSTAPRTDSKRASSLRTYAWVPVVAWDGWGRAGGWAVGACRVKCAAVPSAPQHGKKTYAQGSTGPHMPATMHTWISVLLERTHTSGHTARDNRSTLLRAPPTCRLRLQRPLVRHEPLHGAPRQLQRLLPPLQLATQLAHLLTQVCHRCLLPLMRRQQRLHISKKRRG